MALRSVHQGEGVASACSRWVCDPARRVTRVYALLAMIVLMSIADLAMTLTYTTSVGMVEVNPLARLIMQHGSAWSIVVWKFTTVSLAVWILFNLARLRIAEIASWLCALMLAWLMATWWVYTSEAHTLASVIGYMQNDPRWVIMTP